MLAPSLRGAENDTHTRSYRRQVKIDDVVHSTGTLQSRQ